MQDSHQKRIFRKARKDTWNKFVNSLNSRTPGINSGNGNNKPRTIPPLERGGNLITSPEEIADHYANISRGPHKKSKQEKNRNKKREELPYNKPFTNKELKAAMTNKKIQHLKRILFIHR